MRANRALSLMFPAVCALTLLAACATTGAPDAAPASADTAQANDEAAGPADIGSMLPPAPTGFEAPVEVAARDTKDIFEQINGGSFSYLENGMTDALFATYPRTGGESGAEDITLEVYRFNDPKGARTQFMHLHGEDGAAWEGTHAVSHDYGLELVAGRLIIRATYNDGPAEAMKSGVQTLARHLLGQAGHRG